MVHLFCFVNKEDSNKFISLDSALNYTTKELFKTHKLYKGYTGTVNYDDFYFVRRGDNHELSVEGAYNYDQNYLAKNFTLKKKHEGSEDTRFLGTNAQAKEVRHKVGLNCNHNDCELCNIKFNIVPTTWTAKDDQLVEQYKIDKKEADETWDFFKSVGDPKDYKTEKYSPKKTCCRFCLCDDGKPCTICHIDLGLLGVSKCRIDDPLPIITGADPSFKYERENMIDKKINYLLEQKTDIIKRLDKLEYYTIPVEEPEDCDLTKENKSKIIIRADGMPEDQRKKLMEEMNKDNNDKYVWIFNKCCRYNEDEECCCENNVCNDCCVRPCGCCGYDEGCSECVKENAPNEVSIVTGADSPRINQLNEISIAINYLLKRDRENTHNPIMSKEERKALYKAQGFLFDEDEKDFTTKASGNIEKSYTTEKVDCGTPKKFSSCDMPIEECKNPKHDLEEEVIRRYNEAVLFYNKACNDDTITSEHRMEVMNQAALLQGILDYCGIEY